MNSQLLTRTEANLIQERFSRIPAVSALYLDRAGSALCVTIAVSSFTDEVQNSVIETEQAIMAEFPETSFDFDVLFQNGRPLSELIAPEIPFFQRT